MDPLDFPVAYEPTNRDDEGSSVLGLPSGSFARFMGLSSLFAFLPQSYLYNSIRLLVLGSVIETGRRLCQWLLERFKLRMSRSNLSLSQMGASYHSCRILYFGTIRRGRSSLRMDSSLSCLFRYLFLVFDFPPIAEIDPRKCVA
jgi:hypothetical protein